MFHRLLIAAILPAVSQRMKHWIYQLGGLGFFPLGILDSSILPIPGSMDVLTIVLTARSPDLWLYYALMATAGSVLGGFVTYRIARKGGKEMLASRFSTSALNRVYAIFERWGFGSLAIPALMPPPVPMVPFLLAAGALQYSVRKFLGALTLGRSVRFTLLAFLAARYGRGMLEFVTRAGHARLVTITVLIITAIAGCVLVLASKKERRVQPLQSARVK